MSAIATRKRTRPVGEPNVTVEAEPFRRWLKRQNRSGWTTFLSDNQVRYLERVLDENRDLQRLDPYYLDEIFIALDRPWMLNELYPD